jgi:hypothetical protein
MRRRNNEVVLLATIEYGYKDRNQGRRLRPNSDSPYERLERDARRVIEVELPSDLRRIYGLEVQTRILDVQAGSLLVFFSAVVSGLGFLSSYASFFDSVKLIKQHGALLLERAARDYPGPDFEISVVEQFPTLPDPSDFQPWRRLRKMFGPEADELWRASLFTGHQRPNRDAFFWFLLIFNILLVAAIGILVGSAVIKTYFH